MISELLQITDAAVGASLPVTTRHVYATLAGGQPVVHVGNGNHTPVANDMTGYWSYQRIRGEASAAHAQVAGDPCLAVRLTVPLRIVALLDKDTCIDQALRLVTALKGSSQEAQVATKAFAVEFERINWSFDQLAGQEFNPLPQIPVHRTLLVVDCTVRVTGSAACLSDCTPVDVTCALIQAATLDKIRECLGDRINELCEGGGPCDPLNYSLADTDGNILLSGIEEDPCGKELPLVAPDGTVTRDGQPFGSVLSGGTIDVPSSCDPCPIDIEVRNSAGTLVDSDTVEDACEQGRPVELLAPDATPTWDGLTWISIPSGTSPDIDCSTNVPAAYLQDGGSRTGTYKADGTVNGKTRWRLDASHTIEYSGARWELLHPGGSEQAALGDEDFPWEADWSGTGITVTQATIGQYCDDCPEPEPCPLEVNINDTPFVTVEDPCTTPTLGIAVENEDGAPVGNEVDGVWVVPTAKSLCTLIQEAETTEAITDCIISAGKRPAVQCVLLGATDAGDVVDEVYDCLTTAAQEALEDALFPDGAAIIYNFGRSYTSCGGR